MPRAQLMSGLKRAMSTMSGANSPRVIIIGAGIAGIACGEYLTRNGMTNFKILEATDRTGGRIWSVDLGDNRGKVELGATWIHGTEQNSIYTIAEENHLLQAQKECVRHKTLFITEDGQHVNETVTEEANNLYERAMQQCERFYNTNPSANGTVAHYFWKFLKKLSGYNNGNKHAQDLVLQQRLLRECSSVGCESLDAVSFSGFWGYEELAGKHCKVPHGFERIFEALKKNVPQVNIGLQSPVRCVYWDRCVDDSMHRDGYPVCVELESGQKMFADHVVVTVSLGVLKASAQTLFQPSLPKNKLSAIDQLGFGIANKVMLEFDEQILDSDVSRIELLWDKMPEEACSDVRNPWFKSLYAFQVDHDNVLTSWLTGKEAIFVESIPEEQIAIDCVTVLKTFLKKDIPMPKRVIRTKWGSNRFTQGSYSHLPTDTSTNDMELLSKPLNSKREEKPHVLFAGEATHKSFFSTAHGALLTGQREARRILDIYGH